MIDLSSHATRSAVPPPPQVRTESPDWPLALRLVVPDPDLATLAQTLPRHEAEITLTRIQAGSGILYYPWLPLEALPSTFSSSVLSLTRPLV
jgi:hypothetical protein